MFALSAMDVTRDGSLLVPSTASVNVSPFEVVTSTT